MTLPAPGIQTGNLCEHVTATFTRPADTTAYASADLVANSTTAGSVTPMSFAVGRPNAGGQIRRVRIVKSGTSAANATFRLHLYSASPTVANGDNGAFSTDKAANYNGFVDVTAANTVAFTDGTAVHGCASRCFHLPV